jgi:hypothetical protein
MGIVSGRGRTWQNALQKGMAKNGGLSGSRRACDDPPKAQVWVPLSTEDMIEPPRRDHVMIRDITALKRSIAIPCARRNRRRSADTLACPEWQTIREAAV